MPRKNRNKTASPKLLKDAYEFIGEVEWHFDLICGEDGEKAKWERRKSRILDELWGVIQAHDPVFSRFGSYPLHQVDPYSWLGGGKISGAAQSAAMISFLYNFHRGQGLRSKEVYEWMTRATEKSEDALRELVKNRTKMPLPDFPDLAHKIETLDYEEMLCRGEIRAGKATPDALRRIQRKKKLLAELAAALKNRG
jgi:hypothetical protein